MNRVIVWMVHGVGLGILFAFANLVYSFWTKQITVARRPLYWLKAGLELTMLGLYGNFLVQQAGRTGLPRGLTAIGTVMVFLLIGIDWIVTHYVDRQEYRQLLRLEAEHRLGEE